MTELDEKRRAVGAMWGAADYERLAELLAPIHERLVHALDPQPGDRWLDLATGTGEVALRAARRGAVVTGVDLSERLLDQARAKADAEDLDIEWVLADVQRMPLEDEGFDVVSSCFGVIFAPDPGAVAVELARVCRQGGRFGLTTWTPDEDTDAFWKPFVDQSSPAQPDVWGDPDALRTLLGAEFDLRVEADEWFVDGDSPEALWELFVAAAPPLKALHDSLEPERRAEMRALYLQLHEQYRTNGGVRVPREYLLVHGRRR